MNVCAGTMTSSPGPMPADAIAMVRAAVPEATPTHSATPHDAANSASKRSTSSPRTNAPPFTTRSNAAASSRPSAACWRSSATNGTTLSSSGVAPFVALASHVVVPRPTARLSALARSHSIVRLDHPRSRGW